jgi:cellulose biosynthesis protein BcsQ
MSSDGGLVVTFYSYKGGVGRSFCLANVAAVLAEWGHRVLCVDWDIEAPGLENYFSAWIQGKKAGLVDMIGAVARGRRPSWRNYTTTVDFAKSKHPGKLQLITAGSRNEGYVDLIQKLDWSELYEKHSLGEFLETTRSQWKRHFDFILIDSRTGVSDIGGICTIQMPDILCFLFTANDQSLQGACEIARRSIQSRRHLPVTRSRLLALPIVSRFEMRVEFGIATEWLAKIEKQLGDFVAPWLPRQTKSSELIECTRIPSVPYWSFGEKLPVVVDAERNDDTESVNYFLRNIAALVANRLTDANQLVLSRDSYLVRSLRSQSASLPGTRRAGAEVFISHPQEVEGIASALRGELLKRGYGVRMSGDIENLSGRVRTHLLEDLRKANFFVPLFAEGASSWQHTEIEAFVSANVRDLGNNTIVPVVLTDEGLETIPDILVDLTIVDGRSLPPEKIAKKLITEIVSRRRAERTPRARRALRLK